MDAAGVRTREDAAALDRADPLAALRDEFELPEGVVYLAGHSLGALPRAAVAQVERAARDEWGRDLVTSWTRHGWIDLPLKLGDAIGRLIGAAPGQVAVADSTSVNLFKLLAVALRLRPGRRVIVSERDNFPTDLYVAEGLTALLGDGHELRLVDAGGLEAALGDEVAVVALSHVNYRDGALHDMAVVTRQVQSSGALMLWDLSHSAGALPVSLDRCGVDLAVGCTYKYLSGGPGAPAYLYVAQRLQEAARQPLSGWMGHAAPFAFEPEYRPAPGIGRQLCGTPPVLSMSAIGAGVELLERAGMAAVRAKSLALAELLIRLAERSCGRLGLTLASPREATRRGSQVCFRHPDAYPVARALIARGVIGDFRAPDVLRFGLAPLYLRFIDVWNAAAALADVLATGAWDRPEFRAVKRVT
jgi:kynureninase